MRKGNMLEVATLVKSTMTAPRMEQEKKIPQRADTNFASGKEIPPAAPEIIMKSPIIEKRPRMVTITEMFKRKPAYFPMI